jgi:hypothetical protein
MTANAQLLRLHRARRRAKKSSTFFTEMIEYMRGRANRYRLKGMDFGADLLEDALSELERLEGLSPSKGEFPQDFNVPESREQDFNLQ